MDPASTRLRGAPAKRLSSVSGVMGVTGKPQMGRGGGLLSAVGSEQLLLGIRHFKEAIQTGFSQNPLAAM